MRELCRVLDSEPEAMNNLIYLAAQKPSNRARCERYLQIAQSAI